jgi:hypothetical protein
MSLQTWQETLVSAPASGASFGTYTTAKTVLPSGCLVTLPANWWYIGRVIRVTVQGGIGTLVTTPGTITLQHNIGSTAVFSSGAIQLNATAHTNLPFELVTTLRCVSIGASTSATLLGQAHLHGVMFTRTAGQTDQANIGDSMMVPITAPAAGTGFDSTAAGTLDFFAGFSISNAANTIQIYNYIVEALN